jgi:type IV secretory pathway VirB4 component
VAFESAEFNLVKDRHDAWCNVLRNLPAGRTAVYHHRIHRRIHDRLTDATEPEFSAAFSKAYQDRISVAPMMSNELYITLLYRPFPSELAKRSVRASRTKESLTDYQNPDAGHDGTAGRAHRAQPARVRTDPARLLRTGREPVLGVGRAVLLPDQRCVAQGALPHRPRVPGACQTLA